MDEEKLDDLILDAAAELQEQQMEVARARIVGKLREIEKSKKITRALENELEALKLEILGA